MAVSSERPEFDKKNWYRAVLRERHLAVVKDLEVVLCESVRVHGHSETLLSSIPSSIVMPAQRRCRVDQLQQRRQLSVEYLKPRRLQELQLLEIALICSDSSERTNLCLLSPRNWLRSTRHWRQSRAPAPGRSSSILHCGS
jgi:hypothetical protein